jgi:hypothetical protein
MADKRIEKALYGPSTTEVALGALLGFLVGVLAACVYLVWKPVQKVTKLPEPDKIVAGTVYFLPGTESSAKARNWQSKQKTFVAGGQIQLNEEELNAWSASLGAPPAPPPANAGAKAKPEAKDAAKPAAPAGFLIPAPPNFRIADNKLQIGFKCTLNYFGLTYDVIVLATGTFEKQDGRFTFKPATFYFGSCPLHKLPGVSSFVGNRLLAAEKVPDEIRTAWAKISDIGLQGNLLTVATAR